MRALTILAAACLGAFMSLPGTAGPGPILLADRQGGAAAGSTPADAVSQRTTEAGAVPTEWERALTRLLDDGATRPRMSPLITGVGSETPVGTQGAGENLRGIPGPVLEAYLRAEQLLAESNPKCRVPWWVLAGIGEVESNHAAGGRVAADGTTRGRILGPVLNGATPGTRVIGDSDDGQLDGDDAYDRAMGPMQFLPSTWRAFGVDGNGDDETNPHNVFDAAASAATYLCSPGVDLSGVEEVTRALLRYNNSMPYVQSVLGWGSQYATGVVPLAALEGPVPVAVVTPDVTVPPAPNPSVGPSPAFPPGMAATTTPPGPGATTTPPTGPTATTVPPPATEPPSTITPPPVDPPTGPVPTAPPTDPAPTDPPTDPPPTDPVPTDPLPTDPVPTDPVPTDPVPTDPVPTDPLPTDPPPTDPPTDPVDGLLPPPTDPSPTDPSPTLPPQPTAPSATLPT